MQEEIEREPTAPVSERQAVSRKVGPPSTEKSALEESAVPEWTKKIEVGYNKGTYIKTTDDRFSIKFNVGVEPMFTYDAKEDMDDTSTFRIRRARLYATGNMFYPWLKYYTQLTLEGDGSALRDAYLEATYLDWLRPRAGQFKVPFDREFLVSGFALQLIERSIASTEFSLQRDIGLQLSGNLWGECLSYGVGIFNGSGGNSTNVDNDYMYVGRLVWSPIGAYTYEQSALDEPSTPRVAVGVAAGYLPELEPGERGDLAGVLGETEVVPVESDVFQITADLAFKYKRFSFEGGYYFRTIDPNAPTPLGSEDAYGFFGQAGFFICPKVVEIAARYAFVDPDNPLQDMDDRMHEATLGVNYFIYGHRLKLQANYTYLNSEEDDADDQEDHIVRTAAVLLF